MELVTLPPGVDTLLIPLEGAVRAEPGRRRVIYFEASREGVVDREGEDIAADALWASRELFLKQGNIDVNHWSWLGNPPGTGMRPEYVIGLPLEVRRQGPSIFVKAELFSNLAPPPPGSSGEWADRVWRSLTQMVPPMRWFPSVFGKLAPDAVVDVEVRDGQKVRVIRGPIEWYSVGLTQRAQNPALPPVSLEPLSAFAKAETTGQPVAMGRVAVVPYRTLAKALTQAAILTAGDPRALDAKRGLTGVPALRRESLEALYRRLAPRVLRGLLLGRVEGSVEGVAKAFAKLGAPPCAARRMALRLGKELMTPKGVQGKGRRRP